MIFFSLIMLIASIRMIRARQKDVVEKEIVSHGHAMIIAQGIVVGVITGIVGAGGGFLIIPALVLFSGLEMKKAIGTSLLVIAVNSLLGFFGDMTQVREVDFPFMIMLSCIAIAGVFLGNYLSKFVRGKDLKSGFGWFTLTMALYIMIKEIII